MKLSTRTFVIKSNVVEISSPRILESPDPAFYRKNLRILDTLAVTAGAAYNFAAQDIPAGEILAPVIPETAEAMEETESILQARIRADEIILEAEQKAAEILEKARLQAQAEAKHMEEIIRNQTFEQAKAEGYAEGLAIAQAEAEDLRKQAKDYLESARTVFQNELDKVDKDLAGLCIQICDRVLNTTLQLQPEILLNMIRNLTLRPTDKDSIKIHLSSKDWEWYRKLSKEEKPEYPVIVDETLKDGDTFLECSEGIFDATIDHQLKSIGEYLQREISHGQLGRNQQEN
ncbi:flagellar assembly protein FliH [Dehalobacter sp. DCM]|uniref:FliH/SctL family protein n=1 Tax=Dehalobacter sp. DCM TaxID=2907827 RepID=UPI003081A833|nr:flagellar assembly protein FliH [Dehalobacter sp. DCM]